MDRYVPPVPFSQPLLDRYVAVIDRAYVSNEEHFDADLGHTEGSFRYLLYESIKHFLPGAMSDLPGVLVALDNNAIVVTEGTRSLRSYPIGDSEFDDPWTSFPKNRRGAPATAAHNAEQLRIFSEEQLHTPADVMGLRYILGHCGAPHVGLRAVYLCLPYGGYADERVNRYLHVWPIFRRGDMPPTSPWSETAEPQRAPVVRSPAPAVVIRARVDEPGT